nr:MAG TPA: hypothetical protein [Caudoviricetes sp.]
MDAEYRAYLDENIRLIILKALAAESNASLNDYAIEKALEEFGYNKTREYIRNQISWLETEASAVRTRSPGTAIIATLTKAGRDHLERRRFLVGVQRPSDVE